MAGAGGPCHSQRGHPLQGESPCLDASEPGAGSEQRPGHATAHLAAEGYTDAAPTASARSPYVRGAVAELAGATGGAHEVSALYTDALSRTPFAVSTARRWLCATCGALVSEEHGTDEDEDCDDCWATANGYGDDDRGAA